MKSHQILQPLARVFIANKRLRRFTWPWIVRLRNHYARKVPPIELQTRFDDDVLVTACLSSHIEAQLFWQGFQEADEGTVLQMKKLLPEDGVFVDCGANIGAFTLVAARRAERGQVHAFEPSPRHMQRLLDNIALNRFKNVTANAVGVSDKSGEATLFVPAQSGQMNNAGSATLYADAALRECSEAEVIHLICLDDYVIERGLARIDLIKIDIEGAEMKALRGARSTLERLRPHVLMEIEVAALGRSGESADAVLAFWKALDYTVERLQGSRLVAIDSAAALRPHQNVLCRPLGR